MSIKFIFDCGIEALNATRKDLHTKKAFAQNPILYSILMISFEILSKNFSAFEWRNKNELSDSKKSKVFLTISSAIVYDIWINDACGEFGDAKNMFLNYQIFRRLLTFFHSFFRIKNLSKFQNTFMSNSFSWPFNIILCYQFRNEK